MEKDEFPEWANLEIKPINYDNITYYSVPKLKKEIRIFR